MRVGVSFKNYLTRFLFRESEGVMYVLSSKLYVSHWENLPTMARSRDATEIFKKNSKKYSKRLIISTLNVISFIPIVTSYPRMLEMSFETPLPQKHCSDGRIIYLSRKDYGPLKDIIGLIEVVDFDIAVQGDNLQDGCIQAEVYRAPEVILDRGYTYSADIWSLGVMLWDFLEGRTLFKSIDPRTIEVIDEETHLAYIPSLLGPAP
ncbi:uncharacterized protein N7515_004179 [Penicillium bovifimosum]|uniref:Protein kinase domain-containing protein n=1 Tax=Penicillium bovifimosum TaxID=126998 RepID=A0A9W9H6H7_9EURO|nr:uncharacterized protein N7515_004179 [Penicillium bovifimosum]KAJ5139331.1 hypothetical protein N7515_004179 [Penicillium bovifimosum]